VGVQGDGNIISSGRALGTALNASTLDAAMLRKLSQQPPQGSSRLSAMLTQGGESLMVRIKAALSTAPLFRTPSQVRVRLPFSPCHSPIASACLCLPLLASACLSHCISGRVLKMAPTRCRPRARSQLKLITSVMLATHFFSSLEPADLDAISRRLMLEKANPNKVLMQAGDDADTFFIVLSGQLQVRSHPIWADRTRVPAIT
jgi:hypothetical protein